MKSIVLQYIILTIGLCSFASMPKNKTEPSLKKFFDAYELEGSFVLYNQNEKQYTLYNGGQFNKTYTPASTFKICNSLIGLETGVIKDENFTIPWDSIIRSYVPWNKDHNLKSAFQNSAVWYYQELARRVGGERMQHWLSQSQYGNADTSGGIDQFWLSGGLRVSPKEQIEFLVNLRNNKLPFSQRSMDIVKNIMITNDSLEYPLRAKSGWGDETTRYIGWYIGYIETKDNVYYFSTCVQTKGLDERYIAAARKDISLKALRELGILKK